jgi:Superfamily I DNA and RNA helicases
MINLATKYVISGQYRHHYGYVIVDEYQDISRARYNLLKAMRNQSDFGLFCVGDDWQSIYGFAGSDINYILDFESYWGAAEASKIETTYRFSRSLIDVSGHFVMKNPKQIKKKLSAVAAGRSHPEGEFSLGLIEGHNERSMVTFMEATIMELPQKAVSFLLVVIIMILNCLTNRRLSASMIIVPVRLRSAIRPEPIYRWNFCRLIDPKVYRRTMFLF